MAKTAFLLNKKNIKWYKRINKIKNQDYCLLYIKNNEKSKKIMKKIKSNKITNIVIENGLAVTINKNEQINIINGDYLKKSVAIFVLRKYFNQINKDMKLNDVYILVNDFIVKELFIDIVKEVRCLYIVTNKIYKFKYIENELDKIENTLYAISSNKINALKKAQIIYNLDFKSEDIAKYNINKDAIIIDCNENNINNKIYIKNMLIKDIKVEYNYKYLFNSSNFNKMALIESNIDTKKYRKIYEYFKKNCKIIELK